MRPPSRDQPVDVVLQMVRGGEIQWKSIRKIQRVVATNHVDQVAAVLQRAEAATHEGLWACGFVSYEAAPAFDSSFQVGSPTALPLVWFALAEELVDVAEPEPRAERAFDLSTWRPSISAEHHGAGVERIRQWISEGDTYQVNYTYRLEANFSGDAFDLFARMCSGQGARACGFISTPQWAICSASPELFFRLDGDRIVSRPMKGTMPRGLTTRSDRDLAQRLHASEKDRAENLMIVDMIRNDIGRIAKTGSVETTRLFDLETYDTLHQLTSTVEGRTEASVAEIFAALFPCASITGAPKIRAMQRIRQLEASGRGIYTGAMGLMGPDRKCRFNVAIRTLQIDRSSSRATYGTGGGIVWDSKPKDEYRESLAKTLVLLRTRPRFSLLETILWSEGAYQLLDEHLERISGSADYFSFAFDLGEARSRLSQFAEALPKEDHRVRLLVEPSGRIEVESSRLEPLGEGWRVALATSPIDPDDRFLYHKTTHREVYDQARQQRPGFDDVILWNRSGQLTESTIANLVIRCGADCYTPPVECGLLPGTLRSRLIGSGALVERNLTPGDLTTADSVHLINSVRGWIDVEVDCSAPPEHQPSL